MVGGGLVSFEELYTRIIVISLAPVRSCLGLFSFVPTFFSFIFHTTILLYFLYLPSSSYFTLAVPMREVSCVEYTPCVWDPRSQQSMLNGFLYFWFFATFSQRLKTALNLVYNNNNSNTCVHVSYCVSHACIHVTSFNPPPPRAPDALRTRLRTSSPWWGTRRSPSQSKGGGGRCLPA